MASRIRLGFIGANVRATWAAQSHFPALLASPDVELTAVCTTRRETAEAAREAFGAKLAFTDFREMVVSKEIDAVAVVVRVPAHYEPTRAAIAEIPVTQRTAADRMQAVTVEQRRIDRPVFDDDVGSQHERALDALDQGRGDRPRRECLPAGSVGRPQGRRFGWGVVSARTRTHGHPLAWKTGNRRRGRRALGAG